MRGWTRPSPKTIDLTDDSKVGDPQPESQSGTQGDEKMEQQHESGSKRAALVSPVKRATSKFKTGTDEIPELASELGPDQVAVWDLGGMGDCGYRVLSAVQSSRNGKAKADVEGCVLSWQNLCEPSVRIIWNRTTIGERPFFRTQKQRRSPKMAQLRKM